jgi:spermidine synthase
MDGVRYLHFGSVWVQGAMRIRDPIRIEIEYVRQMMAWLLVLGEQQRIVQLGLGAGALTRFCHARLPGCSATVVECSAQVVAAVGRYFKLPREDERLRIVLDDAGRFVQSAKADSCDVLQVDLYDQDARGPVLDSEAFYRACARSLGPAGVMTVNLFGDGHRFARSLARISDAFGGRVIDFPPTEAGNVVVLAFKGPPIEVDWTALEARASLLERSLGLEARTWVAALKQKSGTPISVFRV